MQGVIKVLETFSYEVDEDDERSIVVDIVADYGSTWVKVATRNPHHLYQASIGMVIINRNFLNYFFKVCYKSSFVSESNFFFHK